MLARREGPRRAAFTHVQNEFNKLQTRDQGDVIPQATAARVGYVAFSPLAGGLLSGKYRAGQPPAPGTRISDAPGLYDGVLTSETFESIERLRQHAAAEGWRIPGAALRFVLDAPGDLSLIIAPRSAEQFAAYGLGAA